MTPEPKITVYVSCTRCENSHMVEKDFGLPAPLRSFVCVNCAEVQIFDGNFVSEFIIDWKPS